METQTALQVAILIGVVLLFFARNSGNASPRLAAIDRKVNLILENLGIDPNAGVDKQLAELVRSGKKIEAIKIYREQTGVGLKEAKDHVEQTYGA